MEELVQLGLHACQLALGDTDLVGAAARFDDPRGVFRILAEMQHVARNAHHRANEDLDEREIDRGRRDDGNDDRQDEDVQAVPQHRLAQRLLGQGDLHEIEVAGSGGGRGRRHHVTAAIDQDHAAGRREEHVKGIADQGNAMENALPERLVGAFTQIEGGVDDQRFVRGQDKTAYVVALDRHGANLGGRQDLASHHGGDDAIGARLGGKRGEAGGDEALVQPVDAETGDRRDENQYLRKHYEKDGDREQLRGQAEAREPSATPPGRGSGLALSGGRRQRRGGGAHGRHARLPFRTGRPARRRRVGSVLHASSTSFGRRPHSTQTDRQPCPQRREGRAADCCRPGLEAPALPIYPSAEFRKPTDHLANGGVARRRRVLAVGDPLVDLGQRRIGRDPVHHSLDLHFLRDSQ